MASNPLKTYLRNASHDAIKEDVQKLRTHLVSSRWVGPGNIYTKIYKTKLYREVLTRQTTLKKRQIRDYVSASVFNHCGDGWSLLGRALSSSIKGDGNSSIHLAYYAELRAAMSLLAAEGIGVFNNRHVIVSDSDVQLTPDLLRMRGLNSQQRSLGKTHRFVWMALEHWADRKVSSERLADVITPGSIKLADWFSSFGISPNLQPIGRSWMKLWGVDIKQFSDDQVLRNHSSYRPSRMIPKISVTASDSLMFMRELWRMCEPNPASRFDEIDRHLLRVSLSQAYKSTRGVDPKSPANVAAYKVWIEKNITSLGFTTAIQKQWVDFLTWVIHPNESRIIEEAGKVTSIDDPNHHLQVLARAILLLRISTGTAGELLHTAGFTKTDLEFWWGPYALDHGLIENTSAITDFIDLWADIDTALQDVDAWNNSHTPPYSYHQLMNNVGHSVFLLSECERISLWGLGI